MFRLIVRLRLWSYLAGYWLLCGTTSADESYLSLVRPWVADEVKLTDEQRARVTLRVRGFQSAMKSAASGYPLGGQDAEGTRERERIEKSINETRVRIETELKSLLTAEQLDRLGALKPVAAAGRVKFETRRSFAALLWPGDLSSLNLSAVQRAQLSALLLQATEDWLTGEGDPDERLQKQRERVFNASLELLNAEQLKLLPKKDAPRETGMILLGRSQYDLFGSTKSGQAAMAKNNELRAPTTHLKLTPINSLNSMVRVGPEFGEPLAHVIWHHETDRILAAARSPNGRFIITVGSSVPGIKSDHEIRLWDAKSGELLTIAGTDRAGSSAARSASIRFISSECVLYSADPYGR